MAPKKKKISTQQPTKKIDRISGLPLNIIHDHILSSLPDEDVEVMSFLSKTWYQITKSYPYLVFDGPYFHTSDKYLSYVTQKLLRFHDNNFDINLKKLEIVIKFYPKVAPFLDRWINLALQDNVEELIIVISNTFGVDSSIEPFGDSSHEPNWYDLPRSVFAAKSIKVAEITGCSLSRMEFVKGSSSKLQQLTLDVVLLDEVAVSAIISSCPLLEELRVLGCVGNMNCLRICNPPKLKGLWISDLWGGRLSNS